MPNMEEKAHWNQFCGQDLKIFSSEGYLDPCFRYLTISYPVLAIMAIINSYLIGIGRKSRLIQRRPSQLLILNLRQAITVFIIILAIAQLTLLKFSEQHLFTSDYVGVALVIWAWSLHAIYLTTLKKHKVANTERGNHNAILTIFIVSLSSIYDLLCISKDLKNDFPNSVKLFYAALLVGFLSCYFITLIPKDSSDETYEINFSEEEFLSSVPSTSRLQGYGSINCDFNRVYRRNIDTGVKSASLFSKLTFWWVFPLLRKGANLAIRRIEDLFTLPDDLKVQTINKMFSKKEEEPFIDDNNKKNFLFRQLNKTLGLQFYSLIILKLITDALNFSAPIFLNLLINFIENKTEPIKNGVIYASGLTIVNLLNVFFSVHFSYRVNYVAVKVKTAVTGLIYRKVTAVTSNHLRKFNTGEIVNYMSADADRISNYCQSFHPLYSLPVQIGIVLFLLYQQIGLSFLVGLIYTLLLIPINRWLANKIGSLSQSRMKAKDQRIKLMNELILGIRMIKMNAWETVFSRDINTARLEEMSFLRKRQYLDALCVFFWATTPVIISVSTFSFYSAMGNELTAAKVFTCLTLFGMLVTPLNSFPWVLNGLMEAWVSLKRVEAFLTLSDFIPVLYFSEPSCSSEDQNYILDMQDAVFTWQKSVDITSGSFVLGPINLRISNGELIGVIGAVGSGKSSLLLSLIGEPELNSGKIWLHSTLLKNGIAYVPQEPFIAHATMRENILFGKDMNDRKYKAVLKACALTEDLKILPNGDLTDIGERGVSLSGGQKSRISLARAIYQDLDLYLLDDPFSAVDVHVAEHIHKSCIKGLLKGKAIVLCTHHSQYIRDAKSIVSLKNGKIDYAGPPENCLQLSKTGSPKIEAPSLNLSKEKGSSPLKTEKEISEIIEPEEKEIGTVKLSVYKSYVLAVGKWLSALVIASLFLMQGSKVFSDWWLNYWISNTASNNQTAAIDSLYHLRESDKRTTTIFNFYIYVFIGTGIFNSLFTLIRAFSFAYGGLSAATTFHNNLLNAILYAPSKFFDKTPLGRILNRFSTDLNMVDDSFPFILNIFLDQAFRVLAVIIVTCYGIQWMLLLFLPLAFVYFKIQNFYRHTSREIKRLTNITMSPIYEHFSETIHGLTSIRALAGTQRLNAENETKVELNERAVYSGLAVTQWLSLCLQLIGVTIVFGMASMAIAQHYYSTANAGEIGLAMSYALTVTALLNGAVSSFTECEKELVSVERIAHYIKLKPEKIRGILQPLGSWPRHGVLSFENVHLRYHKGYQKALSGVTFTTRPCEKIGIVGRTGSGKSSIFQALFRILDLETGCIKIDGIDITHVDLHQLRSQLAIVPQDPILFSGSVRKNLDPGNYFTDSVLWKVLRQCNLSGAIHEMGGLEKELGERSVKLSSGQRQLFCLARVLLSKSKILCFDEATSNLDIEMDKAIQQLLKVEFLNVTLMIIAHRIETVMFCDRIIVMKDGKIVETGSPTALMQNHNSQFYSYTKTNQGLTH